MNLSINEILKLLNVYPSIRISIYVAIFILLIILMNFLLGLGPSEETASLLIATLIFIALFTIINNAYIREHASSYATFTTNTTKINVQSIPGKSLSLSAGYKNFLVNNKPYKVYCDENTSYIKDTNKYIKIVHVKPVVEHKWFFDSESVSIANNKALEYAEEIHY